MAKELTFSHSSFAILTQLYSHLGTRIQYPLLLLYVSSKLPLLKLPSPGGSLTSSRLGTHHFYAYIKTGFHSSNFYHCKYDPQPSSQRLVLKTKSSNNCPHLCRYERPWILLSLQDDFIRCQQSTSHCRTSSSTWGPKRDYNNYFYPHRSSQVVSVFYAFFTKCQLVNLLKNLWWSISTGPHKS